MGQRADKHRKNIAGSVRDSKKRCRSGGAFTGLRGSVRKGSICRFVVRCHAAAVLAQAASRTSVREANDDVGFGGAAVPEPLRILCRKSAVA